MNTIQQAYINAQRTVDHLVKKHGAPIRRSDCEQRALAEEIRNTARRALIDWGIDKCLALCQTDLERAAFKCLRTYARRGLAAMEAKHLAEMCLQLED